MRFDFLTIFPGYFSVLDISLMGKARDNATVDMHVHDLRDWADDKHRTVDDTPFGGGAGMVMRADIWGKALDDVLAQDPQAGTGRVILAIPTPSGQPLTQDIARDFATADRIVVACGRYEGIDSRVADHYRGQVEVCEYSIGDYVLNGGEVAAVVLAEAVTRLRDGFMGNPDSLVEESHESGLLEYPVYTRPRVWNNLGVPDVLLSGNHAAIDSWRHQQSLEKTAEVRPDLIWALDPAELTWNDREALVALGFVLRPRHARVQLRLATPDDRDVLADLAARTFPLACPPELPEEAIHAFIADELTAAHFEHYLTDPQHRIHVAAIDGELVAYVLTIMDHLPTNMIRPGIQAGAAYLSKCYVAPEWQGSGIAGALLDYAMVDPVVAEAPQAVLGTNAANGRAVAFYRRHGFVKRGRRTFDVGGIENTDYVLVRNLTRTATH